MSTSAFRRARTAPSPANPPPRTTTWGRLRRGALMDIFLAVARTPTMMKRLRPAHTLTRRPAADRPGRFGPAEHRAAPRKPARRPTGGLDSAGVRLPDRVQPASHAGRHGHE